MEGLAEGPGMAEQGNEAAGEVLVVGERPQRGAVAVDDDLPALTHPPQHGPAAVEGHQRPVVGVRGPHDRDREALLPVRGDQQLLARDLVPRVLPERVAQRRGLHDRQTRRRCLIGRRGADEDVLPGTPAEQIEIGPDVLRREREPIDDRVKLQIADRVPDRRRIPDVPLKDPHLRRQRPSRGLPTVEDVQLDSALHRQPRAGGADHPAAAEEQDRQGAHPTSLTSRSSKRGAARPARRGMVARPGAVRRNRTFGGPLVAWRTRLTGADGGVYRLLPRPAVVAMSGER